MNVNHQKRWKNVEYLRGLFIQLIYALGQVQGSNHGYYVLHSIRSTHEHLRNIRLPFNENGIRCYRPRDSTRHVTN